VVLQHFHQALQLDHELAARVLQRRQVGLELVLAHAQRPQLVHQDGILGAVAAVLQLLLPSITNVII
jgi:hypothetical protein